MLLLEPIGSRQIIEEVPNPIGIEVLSLEAVELRIGKEADNFGGFAIGRGSGAFLLHLILELFAIHNILMKPVRPHSLFNA